MVECKCELMGEIFGVLSGDECGFLNFIVLQR